MENHVENIVRKISKDIEVIRQMKAFVTKATLITVYKAKILLPFDYRSLVWGNCSNYLLEKLHKTQNRGARIITGRPYETRSIDVLSELNWQPLKDCWINNKSIFMNKIRNNLLPESMTNMFNVSNNVKYNLRSNDGDYLL